MRAIQKINEDEELTISYMSPLQRCDFHTRESRRKILFEEFGFWCNCNLCDAINLGTYVRGVLHLGTKNKYFYNIKFISQKGAKTSAGKCTSSVLAQKG